MINYHTWLEHAKTPKHLPPKPTRKNSLGGFNPNEDQMKRFEHVDLITLPEGVTGTNCGNCSFVKKHESLDFCTHEDIQMWVTPKMCCAAWTHPDVKRPWNK